MQSANNKPVHKKVLMNHCEYITFLKLVKNNNIEFLQVPMGRLGVEVCCNQSFLEKIGYTKDDFVE